MIAQYNTQNKTNVSACKSLYLEPLICIYVHVSAAVQSKAATTGRYNTVVDFQTCRPLDQYSDQAFHVITVTNRRQSVPCLWRTKLSNGEPGQAVQSIGAYYI